MSLEETNNEKPVASRKINPPAGWGDPIKKEEIPEIVDELILNQEKGRTRLPLGNRKNVQRLRTILKTMRRYRDEPDLA